MITVPCRPRFSVPLLRLIRPNNISRYTHRLYRSASCSQVDLLDSHHGSTNCLLQLLNIFITLLTVTTLGASTIKAP